MPIVVVAADPSDAAAYIASMVAMARLRMTARFILWPRPSAPSSQGDLGPLTYGTLLCCCFTLHLREHCGGAATPTPSARLWSGGLPVRRSWSVARGHVPRSMPQA